LQKKNPEVRIYTNKKDLFGYYVKEKVENNGLGVFP